MQRFIFGSISKSRRISSLLEVSPVIVVFRQRVSYVRQQVGFGLSIAEFLRLKLFILPLARPAGRLPFLLFLTSWVSAYCPLPWPASLAAF